MNMRKKVLILGLAVLAAAAWTAPSFAARGIQGAVGQVSSSDGAALGQVGFRIWSAQPGGTTLTINQNTASCVNVRCMRAYNSSTLLGGGYVSNQEATQVYNADAQAQPFYLLADASMNDAGGNHIGYYGVSGVSADNIAGAGSFLAAGCAGATGVNCFGRVDSTVAGPGLQFTVATYGGPAHTIRPIGGMNPIPTVRVAKSGAVVNLNWDAPPDYAAAMRAGGPNAPTPPPTPVVGVRLYKHNSASCTEPTGAGPWTPVADFGAGPGASSQPLPPSDGSCDYYALTVLLTGPAGQGTVETFRPGANSQGVSNSPGTAVRIVRFDARYAGHGVVNVNWQSGVEGDLQGFYVTRSQNASGPFARVSDLIRAKGDNSSYSTTDRVAAGNGRVYYYQLEMLGRDGSVSNSSPAAVTLPTRSKKAGPSVK